MSSFQDSSIRSTTSSQTTVPPAFTMDLQKKSYLPIMIRALNENLETLGRAPNQRFQLKDFDKPISADLFQRILIFLMTQALPDAGLESQVGKQTYLDKLNDTRAFGVNITCNQTVDMIYWTTRQVFEFDQDVLDYQLLYYPHKEPHRVKYILHLWTAFALFCEQAAEKFEEVEQQLEREVQEKEQIKSKIEEVKAKTRENIVKFEDWKSEIPYIREEINQNNEDIGKAETELADLELEIKKYRDTYEAAEQKNINLEQKIELVQMQIAQKKPLVVTDGESLLKARESELELLAACAKEREELDVQLQKVTQADAELTALIDSASGYATELEDFVTYLQRVVELVEEKHAIMNDLRAKERRAKDNDMDLQRMRMQLEELKKRHKEHTQSKHAELSRVKAEYQARLRELQENKTAYQTGQEKVNELRQQITGLEERLKEKQQKIARALEFAYQTGPKEFHRLENEIKEAVKTISKETGPDLLNKILGKLTEPQN